VPKATLLTLRLRPAVVLGAFCIFAGTSAYAVGTTQQPPEPTQPTTDCDRGLIWDETQQACVTPEESEEDTSGLINDMRELAWAGRYDDAVQVMDRLPTSDITMTYQGFIARKLGDWSAAEAFYLTALRANPDNILARSYYGQGLAETGQIDAAKAELSEIRKRGGRQTWAELALRLSISTPKSGY